MKYFFILGSNPTLSVAELSAVFPNDRLFLARPSVAIIETDQEINSNITKKIGGTIKFGLISNELSSASIKDILRSLEFAVPKKTAGKFYFGFSFYGKAKLNMKVLGMEFKKILKQSDISSRWVVSKEPTLSSVVVEQNKLTTDRGEEIVLIEYDKKLFVGKTSAVQPFKELSFRDYGRPARDDRSGMLPPKLAQIMINLALPPLTKGVGGILQPTIIDPFCGSGTILTEAALMNFKNLIGADISERAIKDTEANLNWIKNNYQLTITNYKLINSNSTQISKQLPSYSVDAIITEPYLGPQRGKHDISKTIKDLEKLYSDSLREFSKIIKPSGRVVMIWPVFFSAHRLNPNLNGFTFVNPIPAPLQKNSFLKLTDHQTIIYGRPGQKVWREIVILKQ